MTTPKQDLKKLQAEWYRKLKEAGFQDIEKVLPDGSSSNLTKPAVGVQGRKYSSTQIEITREYYTNAGKFFWAKMWEDPIEKRVWELHSEGKPFREIIKDLAPEKKLGLEKVHMMIQRLKEEMQVWVKQERQESDSEEAALYHSVAQLRLRK